MNSRHGGGIRRRVGAITDYNRELTSPRYRLISSFTMTDLNSEAGEQSGVAGPGRLLRRAREQARLSIEDLGAQIKLARGTLDALERDDFATLSEPVYVRGYYRKLSKVLPVTEAELLSAYEKLVAPKLPSPPSKLILAGEQDLGGSRPVGLKMAGGIVLIGVLLGLLAFWGSRRSEETGPASVVTPGVVTPMESAPAPSETPVETPPPAASSAGSALSPEAAVSVDPSRPTAPARRSPPARGPSRRAGPGHSDRR